MIDDGDFGVNFREQVILEVVDAAQHQPIVLVELNESQESYLLEKGRYL
jgi:hypothetical protein